MSVRDELSRRLGSIDLAHPRVNRAAAEEALTRYLRILRVEPVEFFWWDRPRLAGVANVRGERHRRYEQLRHHLGRPTLLPGADPLGLLPRLDEQAFWSGLARRPHDAHLYYRNRPGRIARGACLVSRFVAVAARDGLDARHEQAALALSEAAAASLFAFWVRKGVAHLVPRPRLRIEDGRLHAWDGGPALIWPDGTGRYFWRGIDVGERVGRRAGRLELRDIRYRRNVEVRRVLIERYGWERYLRETRARLVARDAFGSLWNLRESGTVLEVENSTPEPDGSRKRYFLRVPPEMRSPRQAVAWTFGIESARAYAPVAES